MAQYRVKYAGNILPGLESNIVIDHVQVQAMEADRNLLVFLSECCFLVWSSVFYMLLTSENSCGYLSVYNK